jgi:hypothetical protein
VPTSLRWCSAAWQAACCAHCTNPGGGQHAAPASPRGRRVCLGQTCCWRWESYCPNSAVVHYIIPAVVISSSVHLFISSSVHLFRDR